MELISRCGLVLRGRRKTANSPTGVLGVGGDRSEVRDQDLLRHRVLLRTVEEYAKVKAREFEEFQTAKDLEIQGM
jgi:hypothetical protein